MNPFYYTLFVLCFIPGLQAQDLRESWYRDHEEYAVSDLVQRRFKHEDISKVVKRLKSKDWVEVNTVGTSIEGRDLYLISLGEGGTDVFLWSQMHGDESTATMAIFDILNFFELNRKSEESVRLLKNIRIHFLPMLNPDGAERFTRRNRLGIDINRDAVRLQSPEAQTLKRVRDSLEADYGFNLHDQSRYYNAFQTPKPATVSFLAPAYNFRKDINEVRSRAMKTIVVMNRVLQEYIPGQVGRYNDDFEPRAFGDNIQKWGTSTILIESGGQYSDPEKQDVRKLNFVSIMTALHAIATGAIEEVPREEYFEIPKNDRKLFDLKLEGLSYDLLGDRYTLDVGFIRGERNHKKANDFYVVGSIGDLGDLSTFYGYETIDATGLVYMPAMVYPEILPGMEEVLALDHSELIGAGYGYLRVRSLPDALTTVNLPLHVISEDHLPDPEIRAGNNPSFFLIDAQGEICYYVINGFLIPKVDFDRISDYCKNALILR